VPGSDDADVYMALGRRTIGAGVRLYFP
jgi:hypothetical protein